MALIECVPNFSEGRCPKTIAQIKEAVQSVSPVKILHIDSGISANRTVFTFVGTPEDIVEGAFRGIAKAAELIDMNLHKGTHPCIGAADVCPLIPLSGISFEETIKYANKLGERVAEELHIPVYLYEKAARKPERENLAFIRKGGYKKLSEKLQYQPPDFGYPPYHPSAGVTVIGVRDFLLAYNVNLNTNKVSVAKDIARQIRTAGNRESLPYLKAIGWHLEEADIAQVSMNLTNYNVTGLFQAFEVVKKEAEKRGFQVTGSELVGLTPLKSLVDAGRFYVNNQNKSTQTEQNNATLIAEAIKYLHLDELASFDSQKRILEYTMNENGLIE